VPCSEEGGAAIADAGLPRAATARGGLPVCLLLPASRYMWWPPPRRRGRGRRRRCGPPRARLRKGLAHAPPPPRAPPPCQPPSLLEDQRERRERDRRERDKREGRTCVELFPLRFGRPCRSELSRGRNGKTTGVVSGFVKPLHAWRATSGHQPASGSLTWSSTRITPARSTFVLSHCDRHTGPTPTPVPVRLRLEV
jgi:hypothetical protein